mmetsp:Transcript_10460/g.18444  ORF Transcript_10460/g.18444 Transcript_10460/m.18444 type:complete len:206 (+) Transcript_10460:75-692(+)
MLIFWRVCGKHGARVPEAICDVEGVGRLAVALCTKINATRMKAMVIGVLCWVLVQYALASSLKRHNIDRGSCRGFVLLNPLHYFLFLFLGCSTRLLLLSGDLFTFLRDLFSALLFGRFVGCLSFQTSAAVTAGRLECIKVLFNTNFHLNPFPNHGSSFNVFNCRNVSKIFPVVAARSPLVRGHTHPRAVPHQIVCAHHVAVVLIQ